MEQKTYNMKHVVGNRRNGTNTHVPCSMFRVSCRRGFTLIEMLIVVAIIGILASIVLLGVGPTRARARDARRVSDLRAVQTALELYFSKNGVYPTASTWAGLTSDLTNANIGTTQIPNDPTASKKYFYGSTDGTAYVVGAKLEDAGNPALDPNNGDLDGTVQGIDCTDPVYCIQF